MKEARHRRPPAVWLNLYDILEQTDDRDKSYQWFQGLGVRVDGGAGTRSFGGDGKILNLNCGSSYMVVKTLQTAHLSMVHFIVNMLHMKTRLEF